jgi:hypothetical protein
MLRLVAYSPSLSIGKQLFVVLGGESNGFTLMAAPPFDGQSKLPIVSHSPLAFLLLAARQKPTPETTPATVA